MKKEWNETLLTIGASKFIIFRIPRAACSQWHCFELWVRKRSVCGDSDEPHYRCPSGPAPIYIDPLLSTLRQNAWNLLVRCISVMLCFRTGVIMARSIERWLDDRGIMVRFQADRRRMSKPAQRPFRSQGPTSHPARSFKRTACFQFLGSHLPPIGKT
jgi:hypothetical protein